MPSADELLGAASAQALARAVALPCRTPRFRPSKLPGAVFRTCPGQSLPVSHEHSFRPITTRRYYPGPHAITLQVNGVPSERSEFELLPASAPERVPAS